MSWRAGPAEGWARALTYQLTRTALHTTAGWYTMTTERIADHVKFRLLVPNVSGGLVTSDIEQRTDWNYEYNAKLAQTAENNGLRVRAVARSATRLYGAEYQHESTSF